MSKTSKPIVTNHQILPDCKSSRFELRKDGGEFVLFGKTDTGDVQRRLGPVADGIEHALADAPELMTVGTGITDISIDKTVDYHAFIGLLNINEPDAPEPDPEQWTDEARELAQAIDIDVDDWHSAHDQIHAIVTPEHYALMARWLRINEERAFIVTGPEFAAVGVFD